MELNVMDETIWSDVDYIRTKMNGHKFSTYAITKVFAEKAALEFAEENGLEIVSIIPTRVHGPFICPSLPASVRSSMAMIFGKLSLFQTRHGLIICVRISETAKLPQNN